MASSEHADNPTPPPVNTSGGLWGELPLPLRECGEIAVLRLSSALSEALIQAADHLFNEAREALTHHEREAFMDAADFARQHRHGMVYDFMKHFEHRYLRACRNRPNSLLGHVIDFDVKELKIVEHHLLDDSLEPGKIAEAIQNASWKTLQALTTQFRELLDCEDLMPNDIPLGPKVIEAAISDAILDQPWRHKAKHRLANALRWGLAARVNLLYRDLSSLLGARDLKAFSTADAGKSGAEEDSLIEAMQAHNATAAVEASPQDTARDLETQAFEVAEMEIARCLGSAALPQAIVEFLSRHWRDHLTWTIVRHGEGGEAWLEAVRTMDDLAWCLSVKTTREDFMRQKEGLPALLRRLNQGMDALELAQPVRDRFFVSLLQAHGDAVQRSAACVPAERPPQSPSPPPMVAAPVPDPIARAEPPWTPPAPVVEAVASPAPPVEERQPEPSLAECRAGAWFEFRDAQGTPMELKLAWVSPHRNLFLLTNRRGERALSIMAEEFTARLRAGDARLLRPAKDPLGGKGAASGNNSMKTA